MQGNLLICADCGCSTGFAQVTHNLIYNLYSDWNITALAVNYRGDAHPIQKYAKLYNPTAKINADYYGYTRIEEIVKKEKIDLILVINDPWIAHEFWDYLEKAPAKKVLYTPVDAHNLKRTYVKPLNSYDQVIAYTDFGRQQLYKAGLENNCVVIPHGVDKETFYPVDKRDARQQLKIPVDWYIVQCVNRNSVRKRIDLAMYYFAEWVHTTNKPKNVKFYYHGAIQDYEGIDPIQLAQAFDIEDRVLLPPANLDPNEGVSIDKLRLIYNAADVHFSTSVGEGWGLTVHESMACRVANAVPNHSAFTDWPKNGVEYIELSDIIQTSVQGVNTFGWVPSKQSTIDALEKLYQDETYRKDLARKGYRIATKTEHDWKNIAKQFSSVFKEVLARKKAE